MKEIRRAIFGSFKTIQKLLLLKKIKFLSLSENSLSQKKNREIIQFSVFFPWKQKWRNVFFFSSSKNKRNNTIFLSKKTQSPFSWSYSYSSLWKQKSKLLCCEKRIILIFVISFVTWDEKISQWNNQSGFWTFQKVIQKPYFS